MQQYNNENQINWPKIIEINKFALYALDYLAYNCQIIRPLVINTLLRLSKYYIFEKILKKINIKILQLYFLKIIF